MSNESNTYEIQMTKQPEPPILIGGSNRRRGVLAAMASLAGVPFVMDSSKPSRDRWLHADRSSCGGDGHPGCTGKRRRRRRRGKRKVARRLEEHREWMRLWVNYEID